MGKSQTISLENFNPTEFTEKARVVLIRELGLYEMKIVPNTEPHDALCFQPLRFPYRESDQANLLFLQKTYSEAIQANLESLELVERKTKAVFNSLPKLRYNDTGELAPRNPAGQEYWKGKKNRKNQKQLIHEFK